MQACREGSREGSRPLVSVRVIASSSSSSTTSRVRDGLVGGRVVEGRRASSRRMMMQRLRRADRGRRSVRVIMMSSRSKSRAVSSSRYSRR